MSLKRTLIPDHHEESFDGHIRHEEEPRMRRRLAMSEASFQDSTLNMDLEPDFSESSPWLQDLDLEPEPDILCSNFNSGQESPSGVTSVLEAPSGPCPSQDSSTLHLGAGPSEEQICFGMLVRAKVRLVGKGHDLRAKIQSLKEQGFRRQVLPVPLSSDGALSLFLPDGTQLGYLSEKIKRTLKSLLELPNFEAEALSDLSPIIEALDRARTSIQAAIRVNIYVYGPEILSEQVGKQLSNGKLFLQDPEIPRLGTRYDNPHILSFDDIEDSSIEGSTYASQDESEVEIPSECNEGFEETIATIFQSLQRCDNLTRLKESGKIIGNLFPHQEEALDFMIQRETGEITPEYRLWQDKWIDGEQMFCHVITQDKQRDQQDESGGGILADEMGMGKTLITLVLIGKTANDARHWVNRSGIAPTTSMAEKPCRATLVVVPQKLLITTWRRENESHLKGSLKVMEYHGRARKKLLANIDDYDLVITTYNTLAKEHDSKLLGKGRSPLHDFLWYRVVLDEAHIIRRLETTFHKAVASLLARSRWCLSGTPIQNSLSDLASLLAFLKIRPFHETRTFRHWIGKPFEEKRAKSKAIQRLTTLLNAICLRRTIDRVIIPTKRQEVRIVKFSTEERAQYDHTFSTMQRFILQQAGEYCPENSFGMFQVFLQLRSLCNHGTYQPELSWIPTDLVDDEVEPVRSITRDSRERCLVCRQKLPIIPHHMRRRYSENCKHILCDECAKESTEVPGPVGELHCPLCELFRNSQPNETVWSKTIRRHEQRGSRSTGQSSKMLALLNDVQENLGQAKSIIFSCWTRTLDLIAKHLRDAGVMFVRIDGRTKPTHRQEILDTFNNVGQVPVLIMTTGTGAFGLNLQSVNRVFIVEPQWNPSVEDQAIARAIRLGQRQQVLVIRYRVENSIEEDMCTQQTQKLQLSKMDFSKRSLHD